MLERKFILNKLGQGIAHILFWLVVLMFYTYFFGVGSNNYNHAFNFSLFLMPITIATTYTSIYKLIPSYLITKLYFRFVLYSIYTLIISTYLILMSVFFSTTLLPSIEYKNIGPINRNLLFVIISVYLVVIIVSAFKLLKLNLKNSTKANALEKKILETQLKLKEQELNYLKMQIHPHFLFNTLNTMYGFALKKADQTPEMILKLSNLLDYLLYQVDKPFVSLSEEINHINDYIELEKLRFNKTLDINFDCDNIAETIKITPMLLLPFIENSFKHGQLLNGVLSIVIKLSFTDDNLLFYMQNSNSKSDSSNKGIGLQNITKRLDLLYKDQYNLKIEDTETLFKVHLKLPLK